MVSRRGSPVALNVLGSVLALMGAAGAGFNLAHGRVPWPTDFFANPEFLEAILRTFVTAVLGVCLIVVLHDPASDQARVRTDDPRKQ
jgi:ABC-type Fe3+ transport system permease subunit